MHNRYRSASPGGEDRVVDQEAEALVDAGHRVERFERCSDEIAQRSAVRRAFVPGEVVWSDAARRGLTRMLRAYRPEVVHVHNTFPLLSPSVLFACRAERVPVVATLHNYRLVCPSGNLFRDGAVCHDCVGRLPLSGIVHRCYRDSALATVPLAAGVVVHRRTWQRMVSAYIVLSEAQRERMAEALPAERLFVKGNFARPSPPRTGPPEDVVVYAGRLTAEKGVDLLMQAWDLYRGFDGEGSLRLVLAGSGPLEGEVKAWAAARHSVEFLGMLSRSDCADVVARAKAVIVPSRWPEPFGLIVIEAMSAGVPAIAASHGSFPELITNGDDGVLFAAESAPALADVLRDVREHPERYEELGRAARRTYERRFVPEPNVELLVEIYRFALAHPAQ